VPVAHGRIPFVWRTASLRRFRCEAYRRRASGERAGIVYRRLEVRYREYPSCAGASLPVSASWQGLSGVARRRSWVLPWAVVSVKIANQECKPVCRRAAQAGRENTLPSRPRHPHRRKRKVARLLVGVDIGGTFTDCVVLDRSGRITATKASSTPRDFAEGMLAAMRVAAERL